MNILLLGSGGREHALAWKLAQSPLLTRLYAAPGNPGIGECAELLDLSPNNAPAIIAACRRLDISLVVIGPEGPLVTGLADDLAAAGIKAFGPSAKAARLEGSKSFTKELCREFSIPTAAWAKFTDAASAKTYARKKGAPIVVKADGLAAGKGVTVAATLEEALVAIEECFSGKFGEAGKELVIEEFLNGPEASFFALCDGEIALPLASAKDHKRVGDGDSGPNTGGMGALSPSPDISPALAAQIMDEIVTPTVKGMKTRGTPFRGILYAGLMLTSSGPKLIEYNVRFGDPECQVLMMRLESDLLELILASLENRLGQAKPRWSQSPAVTVVMAARGYPGEPARGGEISGISRAEALGAKVFHAGTARAGGRLVAAGGRVLNVTAKGSDIASARALAYRALDLIDWRDGFCRRDIAAL